MWRGCRVKATCPNGCERKEFYTVAHVMEEWLVDEHGEYIETHCGIQTSKKPDPDNTWCCAECGAEAHVEE